MAGKCQVGAGGKRLVNAENGKGIVMRADGDQCCCRCYLLVPCTPTDATIETNTDLEAHLGKIIAVAGKCYIVRRANCNNPVAVVVQAVYDTCGDCWTVYPPARDPCDCPAGSACTHCTPCTPDCYRVQFVGVNICQCFNFGDGTSARITEINGFTLNGFHDLVKFPGCEWIKSYNDPLAIRIDFYELEDCEGEPFSQEYQVNIRLLKTDATTFILTVIASFGAFSLILFQATITVADGWCGALAFPTNETGNCWDSPAANTFYGATSGSAAANPCCPDDGGGP